MQDGAKRSSACFTDEERAERVLNVFAGRSPCFTRKTHEQRAERGANAVCGTERSGRPLVLQMKNERSEVRMQIAGRSEAVVKSREGK